MIFTIIVLALLFKMTFAFWPRRVSNRVIYNILVIVFSYYKIYLYYQSPFIDTI